MRSMRSGRKVYCEKKGRRSRFVFPGAHTSDQIASPALRPAATPSLSPPARRHSSNPYTQIVSCPPSRPSVLPVASSTRFIRQPSGPLSSNYLWKLPSICTNSPKCSLASRRSRCSLRFRARLHRPSARIQRRNVSACTSRLSSLGRRSLASVGPNLSPTPPEYFFRSNLTTRARNFFGFARFDLLPALRCFNPSAPSFSYRRQIRFTCR
jgi:hypothetical protein